MGDLVKAAGIGATMGAASEPGCWRMAWRVVKWAAIGIVVLFLLGDRHLILAIFVLGVAVGWSIWKRRRVAEREQRFFDAQQQQAPRLDEREYEQWREQQRQEKFQADYERVRRDQNPTGGQPPYPQDTP